MKLTLSFDDLCQNKYVAFQIFSKIKTPQQLIDEADSVAFKNALQEHRSRISSTLYRAVIASFTFCLVLRYKNPIFALTSKPTMYGTLKKYYVVPVLISQPFQTQNKKVYEEEVNKILNKYDFTAPEFQEAYKQIQQEGGIKKFIKNNLKEEDEGTPKNQQASQEQK